jgi:hypothetical protein
LNPHWEPTHVFLPLQAPFHEAVGLSRRVPLNKLGTGPPFTPRGDVVTKEISRGLVQKDDPLPVVGDQDRVRKTSHPGGEPFEVEARPSGARNSKAASPS